MDNNLFKETADAAKQVLDRFGIDILSDHKKFCSAFSDFAPRLSKENKAFFVALSEDIGDIFIHENDAVLTGSKLADDVVQRAASEISEYLNAEKADLVAYSIASALGWKLKSGVSLLSSDSGDNFISTGDRTSLIEDLFRRAQNGDNDASFNLGERFFYGRGIKQDYAKAVKWYTLSADRGDCSSQKKLADCYYLGQGAERNVALAAKRYEQAAEQGDYDSQKALIRCFTIGGAGLSPNRARAEFYSKRYGISIEANTSDGLLRSAQAGDPESQFKLGNMYLRGVGIEYDSEKAIYWLKAAASQGNTDAQFNVACCYLSGIGVPQDKISAVMMFKEAADKGDLDALNNLAGCCLRGDGTSQDQSSAAKYYRQAAEQGHPKAQYNYGECLFNGYGVPKDTTSAVKWYRQAAEQGDPDGQYSYGWCLLNGVGTAADPVAGKDMLELAAEQHNPAAQKELGYCYVNGTGTYKNYSIAAGLFSKAAAGGDKEAAEALIACYKYGGEYLAANDAKAYHYAEQYGIDYYDI